ncbi:MAG: hypothetical protein H6588_01135 [Flavobacteriales bacterium]|nr:hypothetical protein [Flavobacteriales bacterium]
MNFFIRHNFILVFCFFTIATTLFGQNKLDSDTILIDSVKIRKHSPTLATLLSTAVPGAGQVYNKKYWKVPIIYAGMGTSLYFAFSNHKNYKKYKDAYLARLDEDETTVDEFDGLLTDENLKTNMDAYRRNRDYSYIIAGLFYVMNIIDATVDAHLFTFPVNDNLTLNFEPSLQLTQNNQISNGFKLVIKL